MLNDLRYAWRLIHRTPVLSFGAILILGAGIGITTALFSVLHAILFRPLPYPESANLVIAAVYGPKSDFFDGQLRPLLTGDEVESVQALSTVFDSTAWFELWTTNPAARQRLVNVSITERLRGALVSPNFFAVLGVEPIIGRALRMDDGPDVVVISYNLWRRQFASDPQVAGRTIQLDGITKTVVGVMPEPVRFTYPQQTDFWSIRDTLKLFDAALDYHLIGRLKPAVSLHQADAALSRLEVRPGRRILVQSMQEWVSSPARRPLQLAAGAAALLFLTTWASAGLLLLTRSARRADETRVRIALGASRRRLIIQVILETAVVGIGGVLLGLFLAVTILPVIKSLIPASLPRIDEVSIDRAVLLFGGVASFSSCLMAGLAAHWIAGIEPGRLQAGFTTTLGKAALLRRRLLLVAQTSLTVALLVGACLLLRSFWRISHVQLGFESDQLVAFQARVIETPRARAARLANAHDPGYRGVHQLAVDLREGVYRRLKETPGISDVAITTTLPFWDLDESTWVPQSRLAEVTTKKVAVNQRTVSPEFFRLFGIRLLAGRLFSELDTRGSPRVAVVSAQLEASLFNGDSAVGKMLHWGDAYSIVGVVDDVRWRRPEEKPRPAFYLPVAQHIPTVISVVARTSLDLSSFSNVAHSVMRTVDPDQPIERVMAIDELVQESTAERRSAAALGIGLGIVAMVLGAVGIFAAVETAVAERLREIALRVALGASRLAVWWLAMRQGFVPVSVGLALGGVLGMWLGHALRSFLFEVDAFDPLTLAGIALSVAVMTVLACWLPARQALCVEPMLILRRE